MTSNYPEGRWKILRFLLIANFLNILDVTIVIVAVPSIVRDFSVTPDQIQWISIIYLIAFASGLLPFGKLGDIRGRQKLFNLGLIGFMLSSLSCGISPNIDWLLVSRFLQGLSSSIMVPQVLAIANTLFPKHEKTRMFGIVGMIGSLASIMGPLVGGVLIGINLFGLDWRSIFIVNIPIGFIAMWGVKTHLSQDEAPLVKEKIDWVGIGLFVSLSICLILPLVEGYQLNWPIWLQLLLIFSLPLVVAFVSWIKYCEKHFRPSLFPGRLYRNQAFIRHLFALMIFGTSGPGFFFVLAFYLQQHLGFTAFQSGLTTTAFPLGVMLASTCLKSIGVKWNNVRVGFGSLLLSLSLLSISIFIDNLSVKGNTAYIAFPLFISGLGMGSAIIALFQQTMMSVDEVDSGTASGAMQALQHKGMAIGIGIVGQIFFICFDFTNDYQTAFKYGTLYCAVVFSGFAVYMTTTKIVRTIRLRYI